MNNPFEEKLEGNPGSIEFMWPEGVMGLYIDAPTVLAFRKGVEALILTLVHKGVLKDE